MRAIVTAHQAARATTTHAAGNVARQAAQAARDLHLPVDNELFLLLLAIAISWGIAAIRAACSAADHQTTPVGGTALPGWPAVEGV
jgi:hypothetical protein